ncbi:hypothetical protein FV222_09180 [Methylobacterium sp. WL103]|uniref:hypothetical protein n=1 Tax=Methylobacterium sp. WL103 TaxID=2603891 RepID=UPI0011CA8B32|nr:hypothetical protein [Methylobacterium sp. WL103]TXN02795.1 hypothetical protein FV222_09180 [Methylobacterium sp. WL103]
MSEKPRELKITSENLERIARALDQNVSVFYVTEYQTTREGEMLALVTDFDRITDSQVRAKCIAFVKAEAVREEYN